MNMFLTHAGIFEVTGVGIDDIVEDAVVVAFVVAGPLMLDNSPDLHGWSPQIGANGVVDDEMGCSVGCGIIPFPTIMTPVIHL